MKGNWRISKILYLWTDISLISHTHTPHRIANAATWRRWVTHDAETRHDARFIQDKMYIWFDVVMWSRLWILWLTVEKGSLCLTELMFWILWFDLTSLNNVYLCWWIFQNAFNLRGAGMSESECRRSLCRGGRVPAINDVFVRLIFVKNLHFLVDLNSCFFPYTPQVSA